MNCRNEISLCLSALWGNGWEKHLDCKLAVQENEEVTLDVHQPPRTQKKGVTNRSTTGTTHKITAARLMEKLGRKTDKNGGEVVRINKHSHRGKHPGVLNTPPAG